MQTICQGQNELQLEHRALMRHYGRVQLRCSAQLHEQALEIQRLRRRAMRLHAALILRDTTLAWYRQAPTDRAAAP